MANTLVILNASDLPAAQQIAATCGEHEVVVFDPMLVDRVAAAGLGRATLLAWDSAPTYQQMHADAHHAARTVERALDPCVAARWPGRSIRSWQHLALYYLAMSSRWYRDLCQAVAPQLQGRRLLVPLYDQPQTFYFPSFVPALALLQTAQREGIEFQAFNDRGQDHSAQFVPDLRGQRPADGAEFVLAHLPTCMYDIAHLNDELRASGKAVVNLRSRWFDQPVQAETTVPVAPLDSVIGELDAPLRADIDAVVDAMRPVLDQQLAPWITATAFRARQVALLLAVYRAQWVTHHLLEHHFAQARPAKILLSDHDAGLHGPLIGFAQRHHLPVLVLPHSKTSGDLDFSHRNTTALYHPIQGEPVHDADGRRLNQFALDIPTDLTHSTRMADAPRTIGLLLNSTSLNGVPGVEHGPFVDGIRRIAQWCDEHRLELVIRFKPGYTLIQPLADAIGLDADLLMRNTQGTMADFVARCDLCLMYAAPTSGALQLLTQSVPVLNVLCGPITQAQAATIDAGIVPRGEVDDILRQAGTFVADPLEFQRFRRRQFLAFADCFRDARSLRELL